MRLRIKLFACGVVMVLVLMIGFSTIPQAKPQAKANPQFVISSWEYPDEYGQGIEGFEMLENSTGSWAQVGGLYSSSDTHAIEWNASLFIKLRCYTYFNSTLTGASDTDDGKNYQRHNITVTNFNGTILFSQQNFTWFYDDDSIDPPMWFYGYEVVLNFLPEEGQVYTVTVTYEVFY